MPGSDAGPGAQIMDNWFPTASSARLRRGLARYATLPNGATVRSVFTYVVGLQREIFAATDGGIWRVTNIEEAFTNIFTPDYENYLSPDGVDEAFGWASVPESENLWTAATDGDWVTLQFSTAGGTFLIGVNGTDEAFIYDGTDFTTLGVTFPSGSALTTADLSYAWAYKQRVYFVAKDSLDVYYLAVDSIGGELVKLPLGGVFNRGGSILFGQTWSLSSGGDGGLSEQNTFVTTEGEVAIYQGLSPDSAADWSKVGVYRVGTPMGKKAFVRAGGDLIIATTIGFIPLSRAIQMDYAALGIAAVSAKIADAWRDAVTMRGSSGWICEFWPEGSMILVAPPTLQNQEPVVFVTNSDTGAWTRFTAWRPTAMEAFQGALYFGSVNGAMQRAWSTGSDEGAPYTGTMIPLFNDLGTPGQRKVAKIARAVKLSRYPVREQVTATFDFSSRVPPVPDSPFVPVGNEWGNAIWGQSVWGASAPTDVTEDWRSVGGSGYAASVVLQVTSGAITPVDVELIRIDMSYEIADLIS